MNNLQVLRVGFKIGGGIDQDPTRAQVPYPDTVSSLQFCMEIKLCRNAS